MNRMLVWPWHGLVRNSVVNLPNGETVSYSQPPGGAIYGPGDTHLIKVPGVAPITPEEAATTPPGGQYWAGQALLTGASLYNKGLSGWIFQAEDGTRWIANLSAFTIRDASSTVQLLLRRFGDFGVPAESVPHTLEVPVGNTDFTARLKLFGNLGAASDVTVRLHNVSTSGRTAILAWSLFNPATGNAEKTVDARVRAYMFYKVSLSRVEKTFVVAGEVLFDFDDIYSEELSDSGNLYGSFGEAGGAIEIDRTPIIRDGEHVGDTVTYNFSPTVEVINGPTGTWNGPASSEATRQWMVMVAFEDETPRPCYLKFHDTYARGGASFSASTLSPMIREEFNDGSSQTIDPGSMNITGGGSASGQGTVSWEGPGTAWSRTNQYSVSSNWDHGDLTVISVDGASVVTETYGDTPFKMWADSGASLAGSGGDLPHYNAGEKRSSFVLYSNNLIAITSTDYRGDAIERMDGVLTATGYKALERPVALPVDMRHYGSYNPATEEFIVLTPDKVNWV